MGEIMECHAVTTMQIIGDVVIALCQPIGALMILLIASFLSRISAQLNRMVICILSAPPFQPDGGTARSERPTVAPGENTSEWNSCRKE